MTDTQTKARPTTASGVPTHDADRPTAHPAAVEFIERMGLHAQADGMPRIAGRIMGLMVLDGGPLAFGQLADRLQVSRGSISTNVRLLEGMGVIERVAKPGDRGDYFRLADEPYRALISGVRERAAKGERAAREAGEALADMIDGAARERLDKLGAFYGALGSGVAAIEAELNEH